MRRQPKCSTQPVSNAWDPSPEMSPAATLSPLASTALPPGKDYSSSALAQSMAYANTWLYGTVSLKPQCRPGMFVCSTESGGHGGASPAFAIVMCNCPEFLIGTTRSKKSLCKKCGGARTTNWNFDEFVNNSSGGVHNMSRPYNTVRINRPLSDFNMELDPYMLMRKSRFKTRSGTGDEKNDQIVSKNVSQKSILECHVNPYDLIKFNKYYDTGQHSDGEKSKRDINTGCKIKKILDTSETVNTTSSANKKIAKLLNKFKFKSTSSNTTAVNPNIRIAGHTINVNHSGDARVTHRISEEFVKDSSESEDLDEPEVDYSDVELEDNDIPAENNQNKQHFNEHVVKKSIQNNDFSPVRHNQSSEHTRERKIDHTAREREYKSQSFNHYTDHNIFSQRKHSIQDSLQVQNSRYSVPKTHESMSHEIENNHEIRTNTISLNRNNNNKTNDAKNNTNNTFKNFKINESVISRHYDGDKRHSFDAYRMSELQKMMTHGESSHKRHSISEQPHVINLANSSSNRQSRTISSNEPRLCRSNSQISTSSSNKSCHRGSDNLENKVDLLESEIKPIPRISVKSSNLKSNTLTPVRPPRKSKSIDCTYRSTLEQLATDANQKPRAYSMDRTNSISQIDLSRQKDQVEDIVVIRTKKNDTIKKYKETNQNKLNMSTFKFDTSDNDRLRDKGFSRDYYERENDDDLDQNYILRHSTQVEDKKKNGPVNSYQQEQNGQNVPQQNKLYSNTQKRRSSSSSTHSADYSSILFTESKPNVPSHRSSSLTSDQVRDIRAHFNTIRKSPIKNSNTKESQSNGSTARGESDTQIPIKPKERSPVPSNQLSDQNDSVIRPDNLEVTQNQITSKSSTNTDQDETGSDFMYDFFILRSNKFNSISSTNSTEIKSILKKKLDEDLIYNASVISSNDSTSGSSVMTSSGILAGDFGRGGRKKKQVQFEAPGTPEDEPLVPMIQKSSKISFEDCIEGEDSTCEDRSTQDQAQMEENPEKEEDPTSNDHLVSFAAAEDDTSPSTSPSKSRKFKLQRSESDRAPTKPLSNDQSNSFKDTMRIKTMRKHYNKELVDKLLLRPKEPPPPPPPKGQTEMKITGDKISTAGLKISGPEIVKDKLPRVNLVNPRGGLLEENYENINTSGVSKTIHLKLTKSNADYECIKLFNKYELPSIPEEQKLSPVLNKKETGYKFVVNDAQSALLKEINSKLKRMEKKRIKKDNNLYEDIDLEETLDESRGRIHDGKPSQGHRENSSEFVNTVESKRFIKDESMSHQNAEEIDDHFYNSPEAEPYETIELKPNETLPMYDKEINNKNKTEHETSNVSENSVHSNIVNCSKVYRLDLKNAVVNKDVNKSVDQNCSSVSQENFHVSKLSNTMLPDPPKSPFSTGGTFKPKETSTPINSHKQTEKLPARLELKTSKEQSEDDTIRISMGINSVNNAAGSMKNSTEPPSFPIAAIEKRVLSATSNESVMIVPKKSSGTSILINNSQNLNKSSIMITSTNLPDKNESLPTLPMFHIGPNNLVRKNAVVEKDSFLKETSPASKVNLNVITINITPEAKKNSNTISFASVGEPTYNGMHNNNSTTNSIDITNSMTNNCANGHNVKEEDIYHSSNILIKHDLTHTYDDFTPDDTMLDSLIEIPEHYQRDEVLIKESTSKHIPNNNLLDEQIKSVKKQTGGENCPIQLEGISNVRYKETRNSTAEYTNREVDKLQINSGINDAKIEEINKTFSSLIKDNYDPIQAVKDKMVPHICKNNRNNQINFVSGQDSIIIDESVNKLESFVTHTHDLETTKKSEINRTEEISRDFVNFNPLDIKVDKTDVQGITDVIDALSTSDYGSHYYMSSRIDTIIEDIEKEEEEGEEEEDHYETIDGEPIYDEIPPPLPKSSPPPLPLTLPPNSLSAMSTNLKSIFEGASKSDIINYLVDAKQRFIDPSQSARRLSLVSDIDSATRSDSEYNSDLEFDFRLGTSGNHLSQNSDSSECSIVVHEDSISLSSSDSTIRKEYVDIERNDSGVGSETSTSCRAKWQTLPSVQSCHSQHECEDCDEPVPTQITDSGIQFAPLICEKCTKMRAERREIILEIIETEEKYGRDLQIIIDEFYKPMLVAGLLTQDQLESIFLNTEELLDNTLLMSDKLREAFNEGDDEMMTAHVGRIFIEAVPMLTAFQSYCTRQGTAALILANLEKEKELLRIFLRVSQMENSVLRRMNLNSFLMVPVQRVTKYPLLLARLYKVTPDHHTGKDLLIEAQHSIQLHLEHINSLARDLSTTKLWRKISMMNNRRVGYELEDTTYIKLRKLSVDVLDWNQDEVRFLLEEKLSYTQPTEHNWKRGRTVKLTPVNAVLVALDKPIITEPTTPDLDDSPSLPSPSLELANTTTPPSLSKLFTPAGVKEASLILLKEKNGRFALLREPLYLDKCIVYCDIEMEDYFELQEISTRDTFVFKADDPDRTKLWYRQLQCLVQGLGQWRKRRNALANIMMYSIQNRT